ncbi:MAG TPA: alpha/beta hydrolase-fold protein [Actinocrinis sp.]|jgi:hypothetical protein
MGLTSRYFFDAALAAAFVLPLGTVLLWNRLRGPRAVRIALRLAMIELCQATAVLLAGLLINNSFQLYDSWSDLLGRDGTPGRIVEARPAAAPGGQTGHAPAGGSATGAGDLVNAHLFKPYPKVSGAYVATVTGDRSRITGEVLVWLPPQYFEPAYAGSDFPVVQLLSGAPGSPSAWLLAMAAPQFLSAAVADRAAHPFILVSAAINVDPPNNPDCSDIPGGPRVATWLAGDVPELVETSFRAGSGRADWGLMGFSEGGLCAAKLALQYPGQYAAGVSLSGDDHPDGNLLRPGTEAYRSNSPIWLIRHPQPEPVALLLTGTRQDGSTAAEADAMSRSAVSPVGVDLLISQHGGHNRGVWQAVEPQAFSWLSDHVAGPAAPGPATPGPATADPPEPIAARPANVPAL